MKSTGVRALVLVLALTLAGSLLPGVGWAQAAPATSEASSSDAGDALAGAGAMIGSIIFLPFKVMLICPGMALASGVTYAINGGKSETADYLLRVGCGGSFAASPGMIQGQQSFQGSGGPYPFTEW